MSTGRPFGAPKERPLNLQLGMDVWLFLGAGLVGLWVGGVLVLTQLPDDTALSRPLRGFAICAALWAVGDVTAALATGPFWKQVGVAILYSGVIFVPPLWWSLAIGWAGNRGVRLPLDSRLWTRVPLLFACVMWVAMLTNPWHGDFIVPVVGGRNVYGPLWWCMAVPSYALIVGVLALELWMLRRVRTPGARRQAIFMIAASSVTVASSWAYVSGASEVNLTLPMLAVSGVILTVGMVREGLFGVLPVALPVIASRDPDGIVVVRPDGDVLYTNRRAREILSLETLSGNAPQLAPFATRLRHADGTPVARTDAIGMEHRWETLLRPGSSLYRYGDGWLRVSAQPVRGRGRLLAHCLRLHDATGEQNAEIEVRRARRLDSVAELARGVGHDFKNLLTVVRGNAQLLAEDLPAVPGVQRKLHRILRAGEQAMELADQLQLYAGAAEPRRATVDLTELVRDVFDVLDSEFFSVPGGEIPEVELDLAPDPVKIEADATQLRQVVLNLLVNARDALDGEGGEVRVQTGTTRLGSQRTGQRVVGRVHSPGLYGYVRVRDTGCGMDGATQERIFEPFFSTKGKHRGIGLATVFGIVRSHDALLELESRVGRGTTFSVYFPLAEDGESSDDRR